MAYTATRAAPAPLDASEGVLEGTPLVRAAELAIEGQAFAIDVMRNAARMQTEAATGNTARVVNELGRLGLRAQRHWYECRVLAAEIEA